MTIGANKQKIWGLLVDAWALKQKNYPSICVIGNDKDKKNGSNEIDV